MIYQIIIGYREPCLSCCNYMNENVKMLEVQVGPSRNCERMNPPGQPNMFFVLGSLMSRPGIAWGF